MSWVGGIEPVAYDLKTAATAICMSEDFVRRLVRTERLPARFVGGKYLILRRDLEDWLLVQPESSSAWDRRDWSSR